MYRGGRLSVTFHWHEDTNNAVTKSSSGLKSATPILTMPMTKITCQTCFKSYADKSPIRSCVSCTQPLHVMFLAPTCVVSFLKTWAKRCLPTTIAP